MAIPQRIRAYEGRYAIVDGIPFRMLVAARNAPALMAGFPIDAEAARRLLPGHQIHPLRLWNGRGLLIFTVIDYRETNIGQYIEFSIGLACTHGARPAPRLLPGLLMGWYGTGQYILDLPVSTEVSVKGGKGIWGMPKHQANLSYTITDSVVASQYEKDGQFAVRIEIDRPATANLPMRMSATNYCEFRGMLMASRIHVRGRAGVNLFGRAKARLYVGDHPRVASLRALDIDPNPLFTAFIPAATGVLDDAIQSWFLTYDRPPMNQPEGLDSVIDLQQGQEWLSAPSFADVEAYRVGKINPERANAPTPS